MDAGDSGGGASQSDACDSESPPKAMTDVSLSSKGRARRKNLRYSDYEMEGANSVQDHQEKQPAGLDKGGGDSPSKLMLDVSLSSKGRPRRRTPKYLDEQAANTNEEQVSAEGDAGGEPSPPKKRGRPKKTDGDLAPAKKKTAAKRTPAKRTPAKKASAAEEGGATEQQENGTPKPKRKYVRKQVAKEVELLPVEPKQQPVEEEAEPGGRRRRGAAKAALKYLHALAKEELCHGKDESEPPGEAGKEAEATKEKSAKGGPAGGRGRKRRRHDSDSAGDEDFMPDVEEAEEEMEDEEEEEEEDDMDGEDFRVGSRITTTPSARKSYGNSTAVLPNGLAVGVMRVIWDAIDVNKKFREEHHANWVFPEWVPSSSNWQPLPQSELDTYLPEELESVAFKVSREGFKQEEEPLQRLSRFGGLPAHKDCWDMFLNAGGPVWALEWCPTPDGAPAQQYVALACLSAMDQLHYVQHTYSGTALVQLWDVGQLDYDCRPDTAPSLAYALAQDKGFIWQMKWCPSGGWELPTCSRKEPFLPRLGLLAVASSNGEVNVYSLPHPQALRRSHPQEGGASDLKHIYKAQGVVTLKLGSLKSPRGQQSGQVLCLDWLPEKPHNVMAVGFYDGVVGLWDLSTSSALLQVRESDGSLILLPYRSFLGHDHAVRALAFCPASRHLLVTAGEDRFVKTWDLRRLYEPITIQKRFLTNEIYWPLNAPGIMCAQESTYAANGSQGVHYYDHYMRSIFALPRVATMWSISYTDWLNCLLTSDSLGELILAVLPQICFTPQSVKRFIERRFPVYFTSLVPYEATDGEKGNREKKGEAEEKGSPAAGSGETSEGDGGRAPQEEAPPPPHSQTYKEAAKKYYIHYTDGNVENFVKFEKRSAWNRMKDTEGKAKVNFDEMPLAALHKVRFSPNMKCHTWVASGGQTGLVRLHCLRALISQDVKKTIAEGQAQFSALYTAPPPASQGDAQPL